MAVNLRQLRRYITAQTSAELMVSSQSKYNEIRNIPQRSTANDAPTKPTAVKKKAKEKGASASSGADLPGVSTSKIDIDAKPVYEPAGKRITQVNIDEGKLFGRFRMRGANYLKI